MNEAAEKGIETGQEGEQEQEVEQAQTQPTAEDVARKSGWKPESEWESDDPKRPGNFSSAEMFNARGEFIGRLKTQDKRINDMQSDFNTRLDNTNKIHKAQMDLQKDELIRKRDDAIDLADRESANKFQESIDSLNVTAEAAPANNQQASLDAWNQANPWVFQSGPKSVYAQSQLNTYLQHGQDIGRALSSVDADIAREFPAINTNRDKHPVSEGGSRPGGKRAPSAITMSDLTTEERAIYKHMPGTWKSEAAFLKAVQDSRGQS